MSEDLFKRLEEEVVIECEGSVVTATPDCRERATVITFLEHIPCDCEEHCDTLITYTCVGHAIAIDMILVNSLQAEPCQFCGEDMTTLDHLRQRQTLLAPSKKEE